MEHYTQDYVMFVDGFEGSWGGLSGGDGL